MDIRGFRPEDAAEVTGCIVQLQNYERTIDERRVRAVTFDRNRRERRPDLGRFQD